MTNTHTSNSSCLSVQRVVVWLSSKGHIRAVASFVPLSCSLPLCKTSSCLVYATLSILYNMVGWKHMHRSLSILFYLV